MDDLSSEDSADESEILKYFDDEASKIVQSEILPKKSSDRYLLVYNTYKNWREENKNLLSNSEENNLIVYFNTLKVKLKPTTLWSIWSMLRHTLNIKENINIANFINLKSIIKNNAKGYAPKKASVLRWEQIVKFMDEAPDSTYLAMKVVLIFGICGCMRCDEITNVQVNDVENLGDKYLVSINSNKNDYAGQFIIGNLFHKKVEKYILLRPADQPHSRFFITYHEGKCTRQPIGRHKIGEIPEKIASYLNLPDPKRYTGHCFRRTSATLLSDSGANMQMVKQLGRWRSDVIAQGYIENSMQNRQMIYHGVIHQASKIDIHSKPSTSTHVAMQQENEGNEACNYNLDWSDFSEEFQSNNLAPTSSELVDSGFVTGNKNHILTPLKNPNKSADKNTNNKFLNKPSVKLIFNNQLNRQASTSKKRENIEDLDYNDSTTSTKKHLKFENCTFNNCVFNVTSCDCNKEN